MAFQDHSDRPRRRSSSPRLRARVRGYEDALREALPFEPIAGRAWLGEIHWEERETRIESYLAYEDQLTGALHRDLAEKERRTAAVARTELELREMREELDDDEQRRRELRVLRRVFSGALARLDQRLQDIEQVLARDRGLLSAVDDQLEQIYLQRSECRDALDRELAAAGPAAAGAAGLRREAYKPHWVVEYPTVAAFVADDPRRGLSASALLPGLTALTMAMTGAVDQYTMAYLLAEGPLWTARVAHGESASRPCSAMTHAHGPPLGA